MLNPENALPKELAAIRRLLADCGLPFEDLTVAHLPDFYVLRLDSLVDELTPEKKPAQLLGVIGMERYGREALLRSLAVAPSFRGQALGAGLVSFLEATARQAGVERFVLLTTTAADFFRHLGYGVTDRAGVSHQLRQSSEFQTLCPASAVCLAKQL